MYVGRCIYVCTHSLRATWRRTCACVRPFLHVRLRQIRCTRPTEQRRRTTAVAVSRRRRRVRNRVHERRLSHVQRGVGAHVFGRRERGRQHVDKLVHVAQVPADVAPHVYDYLSCAVPFRFSGQMRGSKRSVAEVNVVFAVYAFSCTRMQMNVLVYMQTWACLKPCVFDIASFFCMRAYGTHGANVALRV